MTKVRVKLFGSLRWAFEKDHGEMQIPEPSNIRVLVETLIKTMTQPSLSPHDFSSFSHRPEMLILINDVEIGLLGGLDSTLSEGDVVTLIPTSHGG